MSINFFDTKCKSITGEEEFGLCDNEDGKPAYLDFNPENHWNATVKNSNPPQTINFIAIDNCIEIRRENGEMDKRCDCLLSYPENIVFVELKNQIKDWIGDGITQIEATLKNFVKYHKLSCFRHKRAFVANKRHPRFQVIKNELQTKFWHEYKVRLNICAVIVIK